MVGGEDSVSWLMKVREGLQSGKYQLVEETEDAMQLLRNYETRVMKGERGDDIVKVWMNYN